GLSRYQRIGRLPAFNPVEPVRRVRRGLASQRALQGRQGRLGVAIDLEIQRHPAVAQFVDVQVDTGDAALFDSLVRQAAGLPQVEGGSDPDQQVGLVHCQV